MNFPNPILICDSNEDFRIFLRELLTQNGYFHILEAKDEREALSTFAGNSNLFMIIESRSLTDSLLTLLEGLKGRFILLADKEEGSLFQSALRLGTEHIITYPLTSKKLIHYIERFL